MHREDISKSRDAGIRPMVYIVACGKSKLDRPVAARDLYTGDVTRKQIRFAETRRGNIDRNAVVLIASARYGLVSPDQVIDPYDVTLADYDADGMALWVELVATQARELGIDDARVEVMGGKRYTEALRKVFAQVYNHATTDNVWRTQAQGIGDRKRALKALLDWNETYEG